MSENELILKKLKEVSFLKVIASDEEMIKKIATFCSTKSFNAGKSIIEEGEQGHELFIILDGEIEILKKTLQNEKYTVATLSSVMGGIFVGELALIDDDKRSASVVAKNKCECIVIKRADFVRFGNENPQAGLAITRDLARQTSGKLRKANTDVITLFSALVDEIDQN
jgi:CRP-like cAMP-binding protein